MFGEHYYVTDYIQVNNPQLQEIAAQIQGRNETEIIKKTAEWVARNLEYPLDYKGRPTAAQIAKAFRWFGENYLVETPNELRDYGWRFPNQTVTVRKGICFDTACVCTTLLRIKKVEAFTVLGGVLKTKNHKLLGLHSWTEAKTTQGKWVVVETTVHPDPPDLVLCRDLYNSKLPITYDPFAWFNEASYIEDKKKAAMYETLLEEMM